LRNEKKRGQVCTFARRERKAGLKKKTIISEKPSINHHHVLHHKKKGEATLLMTWWNIFGHENTLHAPP
jgi:hypothetical protein